jgi:hypothetical protein
MSEEKEGEASDFEQDSWKKNGKGQGCDSAMPVKAIPTLRAC